MNIWPFHNYTPVIQASDISSTSIRSKAATACVDKVGRPLPNQFPPLPKRSLPTPKQESRTDRIKRANSKV
jgi:hypothetical protein